MIEKRIMKHIQFGNVRHMQTMQLFFSQQIIDRIKSHELNKWLSLWRRKTTFSNTFTLLIKWQDLFYHLEDYFVAV